MLDRLFIASALLALMLVFDGAIAATGGDPELGRRLYRAGILASGQPVEATVQPGLPLRGADAACVNCHRRSGFGANEGYTTVRPITAPYLFEPDNVYQKRIQRNIGRAPDAPIAYDDASLLRTLRDGISPVGQALAGMMPRYRLDDADGRNLAAYLRTLSAEDSPGVDATTLHFATIIDESTDPDRQRAMLDVLEAFFKDKNAGTRRENKRTAHTTWSMERIFKAYRTWKLHVWTLRGAPETWRSQLEAHYRAQPVFAVLGGIGDGDWQPVHAFCQATELPCLFPNIPSAANAQEEFYSIYFSRGLELEADVIAAHLAGAPAGPIVQVYRADDDTARAAAGRLARALPPGRRGDLREQVLKPGAQADAGFWTSTLSPDRPATLVAWLKQPDLAALGTLEPAALPGRVYLSANLAGTSPPAAPTLPGFYLAYPYDLPERLDARLLRTRAWLRGKGIPARDEALQANTLFAVNQAGEAIMHMVNNFSREYFIELIEHSVENSPLPSAYPKLSLGPDQRYASKGGYILRFDPGAGPVLSTASAWIVP
jgi:cytochrome c553